MARTNSPNILFLFTDQQRYDTIAALGNPIIRTPALDRLATEGTAFTRCYTPSPVCVPARCGLMTGVAPHRSGCTDNLGMPQDLPSFVEGLHEAGYQTHGVGKMHFMPDHARMWGFQTRDTSEEIDAHADDFRKFLDDRGYGHVDEPNGVRSEYYYIPQPSQLPAPLHHTTWVADRSTDFLRERDRSKPFFLMSSFIKPHPPFESPTPWNKLYRAAEMPAPFRPEGYQHLLTYWNKVQNRYKYRDAGFDDLLLRTMAAAYYSCISFIDFQIGRILAALGEDLDNTLIVFSSDHGEFLGDYGCVGKRTMHEVSARVPLLLRWPGRIAAGGRCARPVSLLDLFPTFLAAAGAEDEEQSAEGVDLVGLAEGQGTRSHVFSQFQHGAYGQYMVTDGRWKYSYSAPDRQEWLIDLETDPSEMRNLAGNPLHEAKCAELRKILIGRFERDSYWTAVEHGQWREYPMPTLPATPDAGLLFQDPDNTTARVAELGDYARAVTVKGDSGFRLIKEALIAHYDTGLSNGQGVRPHRKVRGD